MRDTAIVAVSDAFHYLLEYPFRLLLIQPSVALALQIAVEGATSNVLHDEDDVLRSVDDLIEADDVLVSHLFHQLYLPLHTLPSVWIHELVLFVDFHGYFLVSWLVKAYSHHGVGTLANLLSDDILV